MDEVCVNCGLPLAEDNKCACETELCFHCCACDPGCACGCNEKQTASE